MPLLTFCRVRLEVDVRLRRQLCIHRLTWDSSHFKSIGKGMEKVAKAKRKHREEDDEDGRRRRQQR
eukprot:5562922-Pleurochrysis_carterae.AAC.1